jgi:hypothetical protein
VNKTKGKPEPAWAMMRGIGSEIWTLKIQT